MFYGALIQKLEQGSVCEPETLHDAAAAIRGLQARVTVLENAIKQHQAFVRSHADSVQPNDDRLWLVLTQQTL